MTEDPQAAGRPVEPSPPREAGPARLPLEPIDPQMTSIQPGGGVIMRLELAWGGLRRRFLKTFRPGYVARMRELRQGDDNRCPHEVLDPRDLKFHVNQGGYRWTSEDDPFRWRDNLPFARAGLAELIVFSLLTYGGGIVLIVLPFLLGLTGLAARICWVVAGLLLVLGLLITWFFRNPARTIPQEAGLVVSPADGKVVQIDELEHDEFVGGPAVLVGIFLSVFNVHINRVPVACRVIGVQYKPGRCMNALYPESVQVNERVSVRLEESEPPHRRFVVRQITGALARRIVCQVKPGDELTRGEQFGMIKLGSRTELILPREQGLEIVARLGQNVQAGASIVARYGAVVSGQ